MPHTQKQTKNWWASSGQVKKVRDGTVHGWGPHQKCMRTRKSQQSTKKNKQVVKNTIKSIKKCCLIISWLSNKEKVHESLLMGWMPHRNYMYTVFYE